MHLDFTCVCLVLNVVSKFDWNVIDFNCKRLRGGLLTIIRLFWRIFDELLSLYVGKKWHGNFTTNKFVYIQQGNKATDKQTDTIWVGLFVVLEQLSLNNLLLTKNLHHWHGNTWVDHGISFMTFAVNLVKKNSVILFTPTRSESRNTVFSNFVFILFLKFDEALKQKRMDIWQP